MSAASNSTKKVHPLPERPRARPPFPFSAIVGQEEMKRALVLTAIDPSIGGVLVFGDRGTGKSTAVRALAALLPEIEAVEGCPVNAARHDQCPDWAQIMPGAPIVRKPTPVVDLPLGVSEDRVVGALDIERAIARGEKAFEPGLLARANRGYLYIDEVNLLEDHIVDLLLDVAQSGENVVERDGLSIRHPARFVLVGSGNPEEGELRPQLLDRFGLSVEVTSPRDIATRVEVITRRDAYETGPEAFLPEWQAQDAGLRRAILAARAALPKVKTPGTTLHDCAALCIEIGSDGLRGELTLLRAARALAAFEGAKAVKRPHVKAVAAMALGHRLRRDPLDEAGSGARIARAVAEILP
jgi:magnesium chelatase subunit I